MQPLRDYIFDSPLERRFLLSYRRLFSIDEIEQNTVLKWVFGATIFSYFNAFNQWINSEVLTVDSFAAGTHTCRPYLQNCGEWLFLRALPEGYSQTFLYMVLFGLLVLSVYCIYRKDWVLAHMALLPSFIWHILGVFVLSDSLGGNYDYYLFIFATVLLVVPHKEFFLKLTFVFLYFMSTLAKIHPAWMVGTYFSSLKTGLPFFPDWSIPIWTNLVIFMEMVGSWFLISKHRLLQRVALTFFVCFHLYSGLLVEYRYPATVLPALLILFGPLYRYQPPVFDRRSIAGWTLIACIFIAQLSPLVIRGDEKLTMEGNKYGLYMFESNHQCVSTIQIFYKNGEVSQQIRESISARNRCDPYRYWFRVRNLCQRNENIERIKWAFDHSINGGPFLRIVDTENACVLTYQPFRHNSWIKTERDSPLIIGWPVENIYY